MQNMSKQAHPKGLYLLFFVEMWERFSYYGMRALIVLYMIQNLAYSAQKAGNIYGLYTGLVYLTPLLGGYIADKHWGQRKCITLGTVFMSFGLFLLAFGGEKLFLISLFLMIAANGFFKSNISSTLGLLYENEPKKKDSAFTVFYMGINLGALFSPLVCGTLAVKYGYEYGFAAAGCGMLIGLLIYKLFERKLLKDVGLYPTQTDTSLADSAQLTSGQKQKLGALITLMLFTIPFWICFEQAGSSLTLFAQYQTNRTFMEYEIPTGYFQSLNPLFIIILAPILSSFWTFLNKKSKEPTSVEKFATALFLISVAFIIMAYAGYLSESSKVSILWLIIGYFVMTIAELCISPIGLSLVSKLAPKQCLSLMMGCWFLTSFTGNLLAGLLGGQYELYSPLTIFITLAILAFTAFVALLFLIPYLSKTLNN